MIYKGKNNKVEIADKDVIDMEFERVAQILSDLRLGFASCTMTGDVRKFNAEFLFKGITGGICWFNKECLKSRFDNMTYIKEDTDFVLQELLQNRIIIIPDYFGMQNEYDKNAGGNNENKAVLNFVKDHELIPVCPEVLGGLPVPRMPAEIVNGVVRCRDGRSVDDAFRSGAAKALTIALKEKADLAILQSRSPSCGVKAVYDGTFSGKIIPGEGVFAELLRENGIRAIDAADIDA